MAAISYPLINGVRHSPSSVEVKVDGLIFVGIKSINYSRTRSRSMARGFSPDPLGKTRGENEYSADFEMFLAEWNLLQAQLKDGYGDKLFNILVTYSENGFDTIADEIIGCTLDTTEASVSQGTDPLVRKSNLTPVKILFNGKDDLEFPLVAPPGT